MSEPQTVGCIFHLHYKNGNELWIFDRIPITIDSFGLIHTIKRLNSNTLHNLDKVTIEQNITANSTAINWIQNGINSELIFKNGVADQTYWNHNS